ncbi:MAG: flagellar type III secretion system pore protein FliP [Ketobacteraceae bacterium]|nr:flagellar type III secretion system pore protein FliP [Ketobacteraceae bacterium]
MCIFRLLLASIPLWMLSSWAYAAPDLTMPALKLVENEDGTQSYSLTIQIIALMTMLSFLPAILIMMTSFIRIIVVFSILRQAVGLQQAPSNQILIGLALFLSIFIMTPVWQDVNANAIQPYLNEEMEAVDAAKRAVVPFRSFMLAQTRETDLTLFLDISQSAGKYQSLDEVPMTVIIPAFVTSELKTAFQIGFMLFIPFLIIDLVVASVLMAMGMMMLSPLIVSLPFKIMLFVFVDGWAMVVGTLAASFGV